MTWTGNNSAKEVGLILTSGRHCLSWIMVGVVFFPYSSTCSPIISVFIPCNSSITRDFMMRFLYFISWVVFVFIWRESWETFRLPCSSALVTCTRGRRSTMRKCEPSLVLNWLSVVLSPEEYLRWRTLDKNWSLTLGLMRCCYLFEHGEICTTTEIFNFNYD